MPSDRLRDFLAVWCGMDADPDEITEILHSPDGAYFDWLAADLTAAIHGGELTPEALTKMTSIAFPTQADVDRWLRERWAAWFTEPYPE